ncbi:L-lactate dehydrogenase complex protein LldG [Breoghania corrubedonensis]|uniref:L-lactate dehydrogenase complex protein LldG n=1 Tax=Breoghania corrubedonensis TaxID=665038 RepID=A0A2T5VF66_9HYPH|nr:lactate utilization protein [Breoghania corrubedonensis]PTW62380.1 L-lactate dehydrogenase complex protein LldG [Breoghania corrubedonensis]
MSGRDAILGRLKRRLEREGDLESARADEVARRLDDAPAGIIPARGQLPGGERIALFQRMAEAVQASVEHVAAMADVPKAIAHQLSQRNLPAAVRIGADAALAAMPWEASAPLEVRHGPSDGNDLAAVSHALAGIAETGTLVLASGTDNPTTLNFLPDLHIVVVEAGDIDGDMEAVLARIRRKFGKGTMPRALNMVAGPSRSADIEQTLILGAHGPRALHVVIVGG